MSQTHTSRKITSLIRCPKDITFLLLELDLNQPENTRITPLTDGTSISCSPYFVPATSITFPPFASFAVCLRVAASGACCELGTKNTPPAQKIHLTPLHTQLPGLWHPPSLAHYPMPEWIQTLQNSPPSAITCFLFRNYSHNSEQR